MKTLRRLDERAVSPVIATILLVAITVVLAAVLYLMLSGILIPGGNGPRAMGVTLTKSGDGLNWSLTIVSTPSGLPLSEVRLTIFTPSGTVNLSKSFIQLSYSTDGAVFIGTGGTVSPGDRLLINDGRYPSRYEVQINDMTSVLYHAAFP